MSSRKWRLLEREALLAKLIHDGGSVTTSSIMAEKSSTSSRSLRRDWQRQAEYFDAEQTVLINKLGIKWLEPLQVAEEAALAKAYETLLHEVRVDTPMTCELIRHIHSRIFGELYAWAGRWRTVTISKPGITWPPPIFVPRAMDEFEWNVLAVSPTAIVDDR